MSTSVRRQSAVRAVRFPLRIVAAAALALSLMASVSPAQAATHRATSKVTATLASGTLLRHSATLLTGTVTPRGTGVVVLQRYVKGKWVQLSHKHAGKTGYYYFPIRTSATLGTAIYRVVRRSSAATTTAISKPAHLRTVKTAFQLAAATRPTVAAGAPVVVTGTVAHKATGFVTLEMLQHGAWKSMWTGRISAKSTFSFNHVLATGTYALRVRKPATAKIASGVSKSVKVTVAAPAPTATVSLSGHLVAAGVYSGAVTATVTASAPAGLKSITYVLDGAAAKAYSAPVVVGAAGAHSLVATVTDAAGHTAASTATWTSAAAVQGQPVLPTATINLSGNLSAGTTYIGSVTASIVGADAGGPGVASVQYALDAGQLVAYPGGNIVVAALGTHTISVTITDTAGNIGTASRTWSQVSTADHTKPTGTISLAGTLVSGNTYSGVVSVTLNGTDNAGGSGVGSISYTLDGGTPQAYTIGSPFAVASPGTHTVVETVTDMSLNVSAPVTRTFTEQAVAGGSSDILVSSADQATLRLPTARLVFSASADAGAVPAKQLTFTNTTGHAIAVANIAIGGSQPGSYGLAGGQATAFTLSGGATALVSVVFHPSAPTNCSTAAVPFALGDNVAQLATLTYTTNDAGQLTGAADLSGVNACFQGGNGEPVFDQVLAGLGYTTQVDSVTSRRFIGPLRHLPGTDEISSPYFVAANAAAPVSLVPIAHYATGNIVPYQSTGWYPQGAAMTQPRSTCSAACHQLWTFPADPSTTTFNQNQKLLPIPAGSTTFTPGGPFGLFSGDFTDVNFSDDGLNTGHTSANDNIPLPHYLHDMRVFPAYGPGHVLIPNTFLVGLDINRVPAFKNNDYQDIVFLLSNAQPAVGQGPVVSGASNSVDLTAGGTVSGACAVSGFDGVLAGNVNACDASKISFNGSGLSITSGAGQLATNNQQNALYQTFDATRGAFTVSTRVVGGINQLSADFQQIGVFFGTDQNNFIKLEIEHNGANSPHMTMFFRQNGAPGQSVSSATPAGLASASTVDLVIKGNTNLPDPTPGGPSDTLGVSGYPLDQLNVFYSINSGPLTQIGTINEYPSNISAFFSRSAKAGILDSNSGTGSTLTATFSRFSIVNG